ncbi:hypothetical protein KFE25_001862 [Diacronema lutheri]|uniref:DNA repair protein RAD51 homolog 3 n=1 Tax=Diacronema lutheri TaxID=2081491 RepID=A0A8J5XCB2_DIALT|nr:hypothetical protein KFE25_001862 [Diacronema lutheri]
MAVSFPVAALVVPQEVKAKLLAHDYQSSADVLAVTPVQLSRDCAMSTSDAQRVSAASASASQPHALLAGAKTALELLDEERAEHPIVTFCKELDDVLGGGIRCKQITELCGEPGAGKTQMAMQLALDVQIPVELGGVGGQALYVDTEGSFVPDRVEQMARALCTHLRAAAAHSGSAADLAAAQRVSASGLLDGIHVCRVHSHREQVALVRMLPAFLAAHPLVRLVVVDSIAFHFRHGFDDYGARTRLLLSHALALLRVAVRHALAVLLVNQVTTKLAQPAPGSTAAGADADGGASVIAPALGETWAHVANTRIQLLKARVGAELERSALVDKSATTPRVSVAFQVTADGVRSARRRTAKRVLDELNGGAHGEQRVWQ